MALVFFEDEPKLNDHQIAWMSQDWERVKTLSEEFKDPATNDLFGILGCITFEKNNLDVDSSDCYSKYWIDNALSQHPDCLTHVNYMNLFGGKLSDQMHFDYYLNAIPKGKRFGKWASYKDDVKDSLILNVIMKVSTVSIDTARLYVNIMKEKNTLNEWLKIHKGILTDDFYKNITKNQKELKMLKKIVEEEWK